MILPRAALFKLSCLPVRHPASESEPPSQAAALAAFLRSMNSSTGLAMNIDE
jgi:hypothetical protein